MAEVVDEPYGSHMDGGRITSDPETMAGEPCVRGLRFPVASVLRMLDGGVTPEEILAEHPDLEVADIAAALNYAAESLLESQRQSRALAASSSAADDQRFVDAFNTSILEEP